MVMATLYEGRSLPELTPRESATGQSYLAAWEFALSCWSRDPSACPSLGLVRARFGSAPAAYFILETGHPASPLVLPSNELVRFYPDELNGAKKIGAGGFGKVFLVVKQELGQVAMKRLREVGDEDALRESRHARVVPLALWTGLANTPLACE